MTDILQSAAIIMLGLAHIYNTRTISHLTETIKQISATVWPRND